MSALKPHEGLPITVDPYIMSGAPVFRGTRVPVQTLFDYIADGYSLEEFLDNFPTVTREDALQVLQATARYVSTGSANRTPVQANHLDFLRVE